MIARLKDFYEDGYECNEENCFKRASIHVEIETKEGPVDIDICYNHIPKLVGILEVIHQS